MRYCGGRWRQPVRHCAQRLAAVHGRCRFRRERDSPLRPGKRPGSRGHHRTADRHVLQHRHLDLCVDRQQPQGIAQQRQGRLIDASSFWQKIAQVPGLKAQELSPAHIEDITRLFGNFEELTRDGVPISRIFNNERSATAPSPSSALSATPAARSCSPPKAKEAKGKPNGRLQPARHRECAP